MGVSPWNVGYSPPQSPSAATRFDLPGIPVATFTALVGRTHMLEMVIRIVVIAQWRAHMSLLRNSDISVGPYLGLASEAVAWHCFAIQSHRNERVVESQRDVM